MCLPFPDQTANGTLITKVCAGLKLFDCCARIPQHKTCTAVVAHNGCCEYYSSLGDKSPLKGSDIIIYNATAVTSAEAATTDRPAAGPAPPPVSWTMKKVVSPSMAQGAYVNKSQSCVGANPGPEFSHCQGDVCIKIDEFPI